MKKNKILLVIAAVISFFGFVGGVSAVKAVEVVDAYAWVATGSGADVTGTYKLEIPTGTLTVLKPDTTFPSFMSGGDFVDSTLYMVDFSSGSGSNLYTVDTTTGEYTLVANTGVDLNGFTYDTTTGIAYGISIDSLYTINLTTGASTLVGQIRSGGVFVSVACDIDGNMFALDIVDENLYSVNKTTGAGTAVGSIGYDLNYAQDICFDRDNDKLYGTLYGYFTTGIYEISTTTGAATLLTALPHEIDALAIPYDVPEYTVATSVNRVGAGTVTGAGTFTRSSNVTLTATPNAGYRFINWTENGTEVSTDASYTFKITGNRTLVANYALSVTGVTLNKNNVTLIAGGSSYKLLPTVSPAGATDKSVTWSSSNTAVATVGADGTVKPLSKGTTIVRATTVDGAFVAEAVITVSAGVLPETGLLPQAMMMSFMLLGGGTAAIIGYKKLK